MKKFLVSCLIFSSLLSFVFSENFFSHRNFEIKVDVPVDVSNNTIALKDIFVKDLVIDLRDFCDNIPKSGFNVTEKSNPSLSISLDLPHSLILGVTAGIENYSNIGISKDIFKFLGYGNQLNEEVSVAINGYVDIFAYAQANVGWHFGELTFVVNPSLFTTLIHASTDNAYASVQNTEDGSFLLKMNGNFNIYSEFTKNDFEHISNVNINSLWNFMLPTAGFDLAGTVKYNLSDFLTVSGSARIPVVPGKISKVTPFSYSTENKINLMDTIKGSGEENESEEEKGTGFTAPEMKFGDSYLIDYKINRPMKLTVAANFHPFKEVLSYYGSLGVGLKHPFAENKIERGIYFDYLIGTRLSMANIVSLDITTERLDEIFKHTAKLSFNVRLVEVNLGVALESANFSNSFRASGLGAFATVCIGF